MIRNVRIYDETEKAWLFVFVYDHKKRWIPKSVVGFMEEKDKPDTKVPTGIWSVEIADWWLKKSKEEYEKKEAKRILKREKKKAIILEKAKEQEKDQGLYEQHITNTRMTFIGKIKRRK